VRVRLTRIDDYDLNLFTFDYDLTMTIFFLDPSGTRVYARYGQRSPKGPDALQSLEGLEYTMQSVLAMHRSEQPTFAARAVAEAKYVRDIEGSRRARRCYHCHNVREALDSELQLQGRWQRELAWRYPLAENIGLSLEVNRGNVVEHVQAESAAARIGLQRGDFLRRAGNIPTHSIADVQLALDRAPERGTLELSWERDGQARTGTLTLAQGWRKSDLTWRPSQQGRIPSVVLYGKDLTDAEKDAAGIPRRQLAFRQKAELHSRARAAGIQGGDVILGVDDRQLLDMDVDEFVRFLQREYLIGDVVRINLLRDGKHLALPLTLN
jgi:hypothetical protein